MLYGTGQRSTGSQWEFLGVTSDETLPGLVSGRGPQGKFSRVTPLRSSNLLWDRKIVFAGTGSVEQIWWVQSGIEFERKSFVENSKPESLLAKK